MERLWSYLRRFSRMTKEMRPSHRVDVLTSALVYYGIRTKEKLREYIIVCFSSICLYLHNYYYNYYVASLLLIRWERCIKAKMVAQEILHQNRLGNFEGFQKCIKQHVSIGIPLL